MQTNQVKIVLKKLVQYEYRMNEEKLIEVYGQMMGKHLWDKFSVFSKRNILVWYSGLDTENQELFIESLLK